MKKSVIIHVVAIVVIVVLAFGVFRSIMRPQKFKQLSEDRRAYVIEQMKDIRSAQLAYRQAKSEYAADFETLKDFLLNGKLPRVIKEGSVPDTLTEQQALKMGIIKRDTVYDPAFRSVFPDREDFDVNTMDIIKFSNGEKIVMQAGKVTKSNVEVPVFKATAAHEAFLGSMDESIDNATGFKKFINNCLYSGLYKQFNNDEIKDVEVGSMDDPSTDGNWE